MSGYKHILFAIDHDDNGVNILKSMMDFSGNFNVKVSLVHVVRSLSVSYAHVDAMLIDRKIEEDNNYGHTISSIAISNQLQKMIHILKNMRVRDTEKYMQLVIG